MAAKKPNVTGFAKTKASSVPRKPNVAGFSKSKVAKGKKK